VPQLRAGDLLVEADLIVFDKDGVLLDFYRLWEPITAARAAACAPPDRLPALQALLTRILPGASRGEALAAAAAFLAPVRSFAQVRSGFETADLLVDRAAHTHPLPGAVEAVRRLRAAGFRVAIATTDQTAGAEHFLRVAGLEGQFASVVGVDRVVASKPAPDMVTLCCAEAGVDPGRTVVVGDLDLDLLMGRAAGVAAVIGVLSGVGDAGSLGPLAAVLVASVADLIAD
jgi:phosphoglycolate phosphatase